MSSRKRWDELSHEKLIVALSTVYGQTHFGDVAKELADGRTATSISQHVAKLRSKLIDSGDLPEPASRAKRRPVPISRAVKKAKMLAEDDLDEDDCFSTINTRFPRVKVDNTAFVDVDISNTDPGHTLEQPPTVSTEHEAVEEKDEAIRTALSQEPGDNHCHARSRNVSPFKTPGPVIEKEEQEQPESVVGAPPLGADEDPGGAETAIEVAVGTTEAATKEEKLRDRGTVNSGAEVDTAAGLLALLANIASFPPQD